MNAGMALEKELDLFALMPFSAVNVEMDGVTPEGTKHMLENKQESLAVTVSCAYEAFPSQEGRNPARQVEPFPMLAGSWDFEALTSPGPTPSEARMETEAGFILEDNRFIGFKLGEFFLTAPENRRRLWPEPADKHSRPVSDCNQGDATSIGTGVPSVAPRRFSSGESSASARPRRLAIGRSPGASSPNLALAALSARMSADRSAPAAAWVPKPVYRPDLYHLSIVPESCGSDQAKRLSAPDVVPPKPTAWRRSSIPPMRPEAASLVPTASLWLPLNASKLEPS